MLSHRPGAERARLDSFGPATASATARAVARRALPRKPTATRRRAADAARTTQLSLDLPVPALSPLQWTAQQFAAFRDALLDALSELLGGVRLIARQRATPVDREIQLPLELSAPTPSSASALSQFAWTDQQIDALRDGLLTSQLRLLNDTRITPRLRAELIAWVAAPKRNPVALKHAPLSFQACCLSAGVDFEEMRERTLYVVAPELIDQLD